LFAFKGIKLYFEKSFIVYIYIKLLWLRNDASSHFGNSQEYHWVYRIYRTHTDLQDTSYAEHQQGQAEITAGEWRHGKAFVQLKAQRQFFFPRSSQNCIFAEK